MNTAGTAGQAPKSSANAQQQSACSSISTVSPIVWDEATVAALVEYAQALREGYDALRLEGFEIIDGILARPSPSP
jgi:hypothetical protein